MTSSTLIVDAAPGTAAVLAPAHDPDTQHTTIHIGGLLDAARRRLAGGSATEWEPSDLELTDRLPVVSDAKGPPEKRSDRSDFLSRDFGQAHGSMRYGINRLVVPRANGAFSSVRSAQTMPSTAAGCRDCPVASKRCPQGSALKAMMSTLIRRGADDQVVPGGQLGSRERRLTFGDVRLGDQPTATGDGRNVVSLILEIDFQEVADPLWVDGHMLGPDGTAPDTNMS